MAVAKKCFQIWERTNILKVNEPANDEESEDAKQIQYAVVRVMVYYADGLLKVSPNNYYSGLFSNDSDQDYCVEVIFGGIKGRTDKQKHTAEPKWNQQLIFTCPFSSLPDDLKLSVIHSSKEIGHTRLTLKSISNSENSGYLPTFGPSYVYLKKGTVEEYAGRVLIAITTEIWRENFQSAKEIEVEKIQKPAQGSFVPDVEFLLFGWLDESTMMDKSFGDRNVRFTLEMGSEGRDQLISSDSDAATEAKRTISKKKCWYIPYNEEKPCIWLRTTCANQMRRLFVCNLLSKLSLKIAEILTHFNELDNEGSLTAALMNLENAAKSYKNVLEEYCQPCGSFTKLDYERKMKALLIIDTVENKALSARSAKYKSTVQKSFLARLEECKNLLHRMEEDPQAMVPDVIIWMECENKQVGYAKICQKDLIFAVRDIERGKLCRKTTDIYFKSIEKLKGKSMLAKVECTFWLGLSEDQSHIEKSQSLYKTICKTGNVIPRCIFYHSYNVFQLKAYIFQACSLICFDLPHYPNSFARVLIGEESRDSQVIESTVNPTFDEMLLIENIVIYGGIERINESPPAVIVEIHNESAYGKASYLGHVKTHVPLSRVRRKPPKLNWFDIALTMSDDGGQLLAAFELVQTDKNITEYTDEEENEIIGIPQDIRPSFSLFRLEILFWGLRELKFGLRRIEELLIDIDCAGFTVHSSEIKNYKMYSNFIPTLEIIDLNLPEQREYLPAFTIKLVDKNSFGRTDVIALHVVRSLDKYYFTPQSNKQKTPFTALNMDHGDSNFLIVKIKYHWTWTDKSHLKGNDEIDWWSRYHLPPEKEEKTEVKMCSLGDSSVPCDIDAPRTSIVDLMYPQESIALNGGGDKLPSAMGFRVYPCELENVPGFSGFQEWLHSFELSQEKKELHIDNHDHRVGFFKGCFRMYKAPLPQPVFDPLLPLPELDGALFSGVPNNKPTKVLVRAYFVKAIDLKVPKEGSSVDAYIVLQIGHSQISDKDNYIPKQTNPAFGRCFEFIANFPTDSNLCIQVYDWELVVKNKLIGETVIDLENRYYSRHRATCGLPRLYQTEGPNEWRDSLKPVEILKRLCEKNGLTIKVGKDIQIGNVIYQFDEEIYTNDADGDENKALSLLHKWSEIGPQGCPLVPEHVETRTLFLPNKPGEPQGQLVMWLDLFEEDTVPPSIPRDISIRKPESYELRVIIWNTDDVILVDDAFMTGEKMSDIYVKGWLIGKKDTQSTDVHYRSLTGEGNFNWRFKFPFNYLTLERQIIVPKRVSLFPWDETAVKMPPFLHLQVLDADNFSKDDCLGTIKFNLHEIPRAAKTSQRCNLDTVKEGAPSVSIFSTRKMRGWWPVSQEEYHGNTKKLVLTGKVEAELQLLTQEEAENSPAGLGRKEPEPLPEPNRPETSFVNWMNPLKTFRYSMWRNYKKKIIISLLIIVLLIYFMTFLFSLVDYGAKRIFGI